MIYKDLNKLKKSDLKKIYQNCFGLTSLIGTERYKRKNFINDIKKYFLGE